MSGCELNNSVNCWTTGHARRNQTCPVVGIYSSAKAEGMILDEVIILSELYILKQVVVRLRCLVVIIPRREKGGRGEKKKLQISFFFFLLLLFDWVG